MNIRVNSNQEIEVLMTYYKNSSIFHSVLLSHLNGLPCVVLFVSIFGQTRVLLGRDSSVLVLGRASSVLVARCSLCSLSLTLANLGCGRLSFP